MPEVGATIPTSETLEAEPESAELNAPPLPEMEPESAELEESASFSAEADLSQRNAQDPEQSDLTALEASDQSPVVRAVPGNWGMSFVFGGLAPLSIAGINDYGVNRLLFSEIGFRKVTKNWIVPFSIGAGVFRHKVDADDDAMVDEIRQYDVGLAASVGLLRSFKVWRRIAPYVGGKVHVHYLDPTGDKNWLVNFSLGPVLGIEYYVADRVSLLLQSQIGVGINVLSGTAQIEAGTSLAAGGQMGLVFYF